MKKQQLKEEDNQFYGNNTISKQQFQEIQARNIMLNKECARLQHLNLTYEQNQRKIQNRNDEAVGKYDEKCEEILQLNYLNSQQKNEILKLKKDNLIFMQQNQELLDQMKSKMLQKLDKQQQLILYGASKIEKCVNQAKLLNQIIQNSKQVSSIQDCGYVQNLIKNLNLILEKLQGKPIKQHDDIAFDHENNNQILIDNQEMKKKLEQTLEQLELEKNKNLNQQKARSDLKQLKENNNQLKQKIELLKEQMSSLQNDLSCKENQFKCQIKTLEKKLHSIMNIKDNLEIRLNQKIEDYQVLIRENELLEEKGKAYEESFEIQTQMIQILKKHIQEPAHKDVEQYELLRSSLKNQRILINTLQQSSINKMNYFHHDLTDSLQSQQNINKDEDQQKPDQFNRSIQNYQEQMQNDEQQSQEQDDNNEKLLYIDDSDEDLSGYVSQAMTMSLLNTQSKINQNHDESQKDLNQLDLEIQLIQQQIQQQMNFSNDD